MWVHNTEHTCEEPAGFRVLPGVVAALDAALGRADCAIGLGTGNLRVGAQKKLGHAGLWERFSFGGFADDSEERPKLIRIAAERGALHLKQPLESCRVVVIGDTPLDIAAAHANGFEAFAVATGPIALERLREHAPKHAYAELNCEAAVAALFHA